MAIPIVKPSPAIYSFLYPIINDTSIQHGYGCALYGSLQKDLDIIAFPMGEQLSSPGQLVIAVTESVGGILLNEVPIEKAYGRLAFWISLGRELHDPYIDFSVWINYEQKITN